VHPTEQSNTEARASASAQAFPTVKNDADEEAEVRKEVLARVDLLKELSQKERDYLYGKIANTIRAVGMGGSEFFGHGTPDKNRVVEIWLAAP
jgi:hypothetical protein